MSDYMIPVNDEFVNEIAKSIAISRIQSDAKKMAELQQLDFSTLTSNLESSFTKIWSSNEEPDVRLREIYIDEARAAILSINLKLLTLTK